MKAKTNKAKKTKKSMHTSVSPAKRGNKILFDASDKELDSLFDS